MAGVAAIMGLFKAMEKTGKQSQNLKGMFDSMVEASNITSVFNIALQMMQQETTIACIESIQELVDILNDPEMKVVIDALALTLRAFVAALKEGWDQIKGALTWLGLISAAANTAKDDAEDLDIDLGRGDPRTAAYDRHTGFQDI